MLCNVPRRITLPGPPTLDPVLENNDWDTISYASENDLAASTWAVGDCKSITLNGTMSKLSLSNYTVYAFIIGINHNEAVEGKGIHFQIGKTALTGGTDICLVSGYDDDSDFYMNASDTNSGGWNSSYMRNTILGTSLTNYSGTIIAVIPEELRAVLKAVTKYTDNTGNSTDASAVTETIDYFFLLSVYEVFGSISLGNSNESSKQKQYDYYSAGNSKIKYSHSATTTSVGWWLRSPNSDDSIKFFRVQGTNGLASSTKATYSLGLAPAFVT